MGRLTGVGCVECGRRGHFCQAQMWQDCDAEEDGVVLKFKKPLCLRCADGETCCYETALKKQTPERLMEEAELPDPCIVPALTEEDRSALKKMGKPRSTHDGMARWDPETRAAILKDLNTMTAREVGEKYHASRESVAALQCRERSRAAARVLRKLREPQEREIGGEKVKVAPLASMGTELLG